MRMAGGSTLLLVSLPLLQRQGPKHDDRGKEQHVRHSLPSRCGPESIAMPCAWRWLRAWYAQAPGRSRKRFGITGGFR